MNDLLAPDGIIVRYVIPIGGRVGGAVLLWIVGGYAIGWISAFAQRGMTLRKVDPTLIKYAVSAIHVSLRIILVIAVLSLFGIETTSFAALLAAAGIAIGAAWSGLLANFAAGAFLVLLRPFKVGDVISAGGVTGRVVEIGMFTITMDTSDNVRVFVGNNKVLADNVVNYSANAYRTVAIKAYLGHGVDPSGLLGPLTERLAQVPNVMTQPPPLVEVSENGQHGIVLAVQPSCHNDD
jgi:small conductance mechanosensitive channel